MTDNPLAGYFRKPSIHLTLPSSGQFYPPGSLNMPPTNEVPVYPMTALDEITYKTPDALLNGSAVIDVIKSCIPSIVNPWEMPIIDLTSVLAAIRIASFGHKMEIDTQCPKCQEVATYEIDLRNILDSIKAPDYTKPLILGDIAVYFKPISYKYSNLNSKLNFEEQQLANVIQDTEIENDQKIKMMSDAFKKVSALTLETLARNINFIRTPQGETSEYEYILEFLKKCEREIYQAIKNEIINNRKGTDLKPLQITCDNKECKHKYEQLFTLDMTDFFE